MGHAARPGTGCSRAGETLQRCAPRERSVRASDEARTKAGRGVSAPRGVVLDAGAFIALERRNGTMVALARLFVDRETPLVTSAGVVAQVWRGGALRQVPVAHLLRRTTVLDLTHSVARMLGRMLGESGAADPVDAHVVLLARQRAWPVLTSDARDLLAIDPTLAIETI